jgi:hypothetical protein
LWVILGVFGGDIGVMRTLGRLERAVMAMALL